jgi:hypothetical protein
VCRASVHVIHGIQDMGAAALAHLQAQGNRAHMNMEQHYHLCMPNTGIRRAVIGEAHSMRL